MKLTILIPLLGALLAVAQDATLTTRSVTDRAADENSEDFRPAADWPFTAGGFKAKRGGAETNAELMQRGGAINKPRKLYEAVAARDEAELGLEKRIVAPASAPSPVVLGKRVYNFQGCYGGGAFEYGAGAADTIQPYTTPAKLANDCAAAQDKLTGPNVYSGFIIYDQFVPRSDCTISVRLKANSVPVACTSNNFAFYR